VCKQSQMDPVVEDLLNLFRVGDYLALDRVMLKAGVEGVRCWHAWQGGGTQGRLGTMLWLCVRYEGVEGAGFGCCKAACGGTGCCVLCVKMALQ
jgi:hypothetical protein